MAQLIGTAGHVDHGKTSLIQALTGIDADRLPEEKSRGLTIDLGFAYIDLPDHGRVSIVDVPGHEKFLGNMLSGVHAVDVAMLCVAADESVKPQTVEHLRILELLGVRKLVVAITKSDLADENQIKQVKKAVSDLVAGTIYQHVNFIPVSSVTGQGIDVLKEELGKLLGSKKVKKSSFWAMPIDRVFSVKGRGLVVTGTLMGGSCIVDDICELMPGGLKGKIRGMQIHGEDVESSEAGFRTAMNVSGIDSEAVERGMILGSEGAVFSSDMIDTRIRSIEKIKHSQRVRVSIGTDEAIGKIFLNDFDDSLVQLRLEKKVAVMKGQRFIIRHYSPMDLLAGGVVLVPQAEKRSKSERAMLYQGESLKEQIFAVLDQSKYGVYTEKLCKLIGMTNLQIADTLEELKKEKKMLSFGGLWFTPKGFNEAASKLLKSLKNSHEQYPKKASFSRDVILKSAGLAWEGKALERILQALVQLEQIKIKGNEIALYSHIVQLNPKQQKLLDLILAELQNEPIQVPPVKDIANNLRVPYQAVEEILRLGVESGAAIRINENIYYTSQQLQSIIAKIKELKSEKGFLASEFKDHLGTSRKYAIPLLEYLDRIGVTERMGDRRFFAKH